MKKMKKKYACVIEITQSKRPDIVLKIIYVYGFVVVKQNKLPILESILYNLQTKRPHNAINNVFRLPILSLMDPKYR